MDSKQLSHVQVKSADRGEVTAVFSTLNVVDSDGDVTLPGAFTSGAHVPISSYGHTSWQGALPVGKGTIYERGDEAILEGRFFMDTVAGRDTFAVVKELGPMGQWSYGFDIDEADMGERDGRPVRLLKRLTVHEVSPVLLGAGVNTRTLATKTQKESKGKAVSEYKAAIRPHDTSTTNRSWDASAVVAAIPDDASVSDLRSVFAWVDSTGDPEAKSSYRFPHHQGVGGPANLRACIAGIAVLNGARGGTTIPADDRQGVYNHLAAHLRDADREPPELRAASDGNLKFADEAALVLAEVSGLVNRASEVVALRTAKGRAPLSAVSTELLQWLEEDMRRLKSLLSPDDTAADEYLRFLAFKRGGERS